VNISGINAAQLLESVTKSSENSVSEFIPFQDLLSEAVNAVGETDAAVKTDIVNLALGDTDALHNITIDAAKADLAVSTLVAVRSKALDAYNEIMRITL